MATRDPRSQAVHDTLSKAATAPFARPPSAKKTPNRAPRPSAEELRAALVDGADPNFVPPHRPSMLSLAVLAGRADLLDVLLEAGANPDDGGLGQMPPMCLAASDGRADLIDGLVAAGSRAHLKSLCGHAPIEHAVRSGQTEVAAHLITLGAPTKRTVFAENSLLYDAAARGNVDMVNVLLAAGVDPTQRSRNGLTPLHAAAGAGIIIDDARAHDYIACIDALLGAGVDINIADPRRGETPISCAARSTHVGLARHLIAHGADPNPVIPDANGPLHEMLLQDVEALEDPSFPEMLSLLLRAGADPQRGGFRNTTPEIIAHRLDYPWVLEAFASHGRLVRLAVQTPSAPPLTHCTLGEPSAPSL